MRTVTTTVYSFDELSDEAKEKARQWWRDEGLPDDWHYHIEEDFVHVCSLLGVEIEKRNKRPCVYWSGFWNQGDGACFEGFYSYRKGWLKDLKQYAPEEKELHRIGYALQEAQRPLFYQGEASIYHRGHYYHSGCMYIDNDELAQPLRDLADWYYDRLQTEYEWLMTDEQVDESIRANGYEFNEDGGIA